MNNKKNNIFTIVLSILLFSGLIGIADSAVPEQQWTKVYDMYSVKYVHGTDGSYVIVGNGDSGASLLKLDSIGNTQWSKSVGGFGDAIVYVQTTTDGGYIVTGVSDYAGMVMKLKKNGDTQWSKTYPGVEMINFLQSTSDGGYVFISNSYIVKINAKGNLQWKKKLGVLDISATSIRVASDGYMILGNRDVFIDPTHHFLSYLIKTDLKGNTKYIKEFDYDALTSMQKITGGYILAGTTTSCKLAMECIQLTKIDLIGNKKWSKTFEERVFNYGDSVQRTSDGGYIVLGTILQRFPYDVSISGFENSDALLIKTDKNGNKQWSKVFGSPDKFEDSTSVQTTSDGGYILAGTHSDTEGYIIKVK